MEKHKITYMLLKKLFTLTLINLNACWDWCYGSKTGSRKTDASVAQEEFIPEEQVDDRFDVEEITLTNMIPNYPVGVENCNFISARSNEDLVSLSSIYSKFLIGAQEATGKAKVYGAKIRFYKPRGLSVELSQRILVYKGADGKWKGEALFGDGCKPLVDYSGKWSCTIPDIDRLKEILTQKNKIEERPDGSWYADLEDYFIFQDKEERCFCNLSDAEVDGIIFEASGEVINWIIDEPEIPESEEQIDQQNSMTLSLPEDLMELLKENKIPKNCHFLCAGNIILLTKSYTKFIIGAQEVDGIAKLDLTSKTVLFESTNRRLYPFCGVLLVWQNSKNEWNNALTTLEKGNRLSYRHGELPNYLQDWKCDINAPDSLKDILLKTKTTVTEKPDGSWYADLDVNAEKYFIFVNSAGECFCDLCIDLEIYGIKFAVSTGPNNKKTVRWAV